MCPDEAQQHCDSIVIGEAEDVWTQLLQDAEKGCLKKVYKAVMFTDLRAAPATSRSALSRSEYLQDLIQSTKGCPFHCEFCSVYAFDGQKIRSKTIEQVVAEIRDIKGNRSAYKKKNAIFFADDNIIADKKWAVSIEAAPFFQDCP